MRLCSICDKKIEGSWCKTCHRFVKSYELSKGIYLNERHNPANDTGCTYHTDSNERSTVQPKPSDTGTSTYPTATTARTYSTTSSSTGSSVETQKKSGKKTGKIAAVIAVVYVIISVVRVIAPLVINELSEEVEKFVEHYEESPEIEPEIQPEDISGQVDSYVRNVILQGTAPAEVVQEDGYSIKYYTPEEINKLEYPCDSLHFSMTYTEFEKWLQKNWVSSFETEEDISQYNNYCYEDEDGLWVQFSTYRDYCTTDDFAIRADFDTATGQLHAFGYVSTTDAGNPELSYATLKELDPKTDWTQAQMTEKLNTALEEEEGYLEFYRSENVEIVFERNENVFSLVYYPVYRYE